jgi:hypothetical protein
MKVWTLVELEMGQIQPPQTVLPLRATLSVDVEVVISIVDIMPGPSRMRFSQLAILWKSVDAGRNCEARNCVTRDRSACNFHRAQASKTLAVGRAVRAR